MSVADNLASLGLDEEPAQPARRAKTKPASAQEAPKKPKCASAAKPASAQEESPKRKRKSSAAGAAEQASAEEGAKRKKKSGAAANGKRTASAAGAAEPSAQEEGTQQKRRAGAAGAPASKRRERDGEGGAGEDHAAEIEAEIEACDAEIEACDAEIATRKAEEEAAAATQKAEEAKAKAAEEKAQEERAQQEAEAKLQKAQQEAEAKLAQQLAETAKQTAATQKAAKAKAAEEKAQEERAQQEAEAKLQKAQQEGEAKLAQQLAEKAKHTVAARQAEADTEQDAETKKAEANAKKAEQDAETNKAEAEKAEEDGKKAKENANIAATDETVESEQAAEAAKKAEEAKPAGSLSKSEQAEEAAMRSLKAEDSALAQPAVNEGKWGNRRAAWASYIRTLEPATKRGCKTEKCPEGIALQIIAGGDKMRTQYFNLFYKYEEWGRVVASEEHMKIVSNCTRTIDCWLTSGQIMDLYKDEAVKNEIIKEKIASRHTWRPHPEIPAIKAAIQYLCAVKDEKVKEAQHIVKSAFKWEGELQGAEAKMAMQDVAARSDKMINDGASGMRAIEDYPAGQVPGTPRTPGTPGGNKGGKGGKTEEDKAAEKAARETANAVAREQAREKRRQDKLLPGPRAQAWCQKVQTYIDGSSEMIGSCGGSTCLPETFAAQYSTTFTAWVGTLSGTRKTLSDYVAQQITPEEREVSAAESLIERFKRDKKGYDMQVKFYSKNKEPTGA